MRKCGPDEQPERKGANPADFVIDMEENHDDIAVLTDLVKDSSGVDDNPPFEQKQNQVKTNSYISRQITGLNFKAYAKEIISLSI